MATFKEGTYQAADDGGFSHNIPWSANLEQARQRVAKLADRGYKAPGWVTDWKTMVTCVRCGSMVSRDPDMLDVHDRWHEAR
jgi:hypothetical protein